MKIMVDMVSDFVCPWCFIGFRRLRAAIADFEGSHSGVPVQVNVLPFLLDGDMPAEGKPWRAFLEHKFGGAKALNMALEDVQTAAGEDIRFDFDAIKLRSSTMLAHRLCYHAQANGVRPERVMKLVDSFFVAFFQQGRDIGDPAVVTELAVSVGYREEDLSAWLEQKGDERTVKKMAAQLSQQGVKSVPFFIFNRRLAVSGAQSVAGFGAALHQASAPSSAVSQ